MPASFYPKGASQNELRTIEAKCSGGGTAHSCYADNLQPISTPMKMYSPNLSIWMKYPDGQS